MRKFTAKFVQDALGCSRTTAYRNLERIDRGKPIKPANYRLLHAYARMEALGIDWRLLAKEADDAYDPNGTAQRLEDGDTVAWRQPEAAGETKMNDEGDDAN